MHVSFSTRPHSHLVIWNCCDSAQDSKSHGNQCKKRKRGAILPQKNRAAIAAKWDFKDYKKLGRAKRSGSFFWATNTHRAALK